MEKDTPMKFWKKNEDNSYAFMVNDVENGTMLREFNHLMVKATIKAQNHTYYIERTGTWKTNITISDENGNTIAEILQDKWYLNSSTLHYKNKTYKMVSRNNPMAEIAILDGDIDVRAYGIKTRDKRPFVGISGNNSEIDPIFDYILWYLFFPLALENFGYNIPF